MVFERISLKWKIALVGFLPLLFLAGAIGFSLYTNYMELRETGHLRGKVQVIGALSEMVHETQKERGQSASFLSGGATRDELEKQRSVNDQKMALLRSSLSASSFSEAEKQQIESLLSEILSMRKRISGKSITSKEAIEGFSSAIRTLLSFETLVAEQTSLARIGAKLRGFRILEEAKESGGKLRANMSSILAKDTPIESGLFSTVISLKAGVDEGLRSHGLVLDVSGKRLIEKFQNSSEWSRVNSVFKTVLQKSGEGSYGADSGEFFKTISKALNILGELTFGQKDALLADINNVESEAKKALWSIAALSLAVFAGVFALVFFISSTTSKSILEVAKDIIAGAKEVSKSSETMASTSAQLSEAATEQSSSLQETASSISEISSMVERNAESAAASEQISEASNSAATKGKTNIEEMIRSIGEISESNESIFKEVENNNKNLEKIVEVIKEIGAKTEVINDIVFQTRLLSFNASVEAARAGEHGKGFAVVAEEVGNLATMSGNSALEISQMLESSMQEVNKIVESSKQKMSQLAELGKAKLEKGSVTANECGHSLDEILKNVLEVNVKVKEISSASSEQSNGVREITAALQQLDQVSHQNSAVANESSHAAESLKRQAEFLNQAVSSLTKIVNGAKKEMASISQEELPENVVVLEKEVSGKKPAPAMVNKAIPSESDPRFEDI